MDIQPDRDTGTDTDTDRPEDLEQGEQGSTRIDGVDGVDEPQEPQETTMSLSTRMESWWENQDHSNQVGWLLLVVVLGMMAMGVGLQMVLNR